jgi:ABC-type transport system substrate-binding protein
MAWRLVEPTAWQFDLRPNVLFHDGTPLIAEHVVFKIELPVGFAGRIESIAAVRGGQRSHRAHRDQVPRPAALGLHTPATWRVFVLDE